ncbi:MAG: O-antigen polymerase [Verrucomicrobia bacterium]|nr:O-antigen polymerase [Verrucomicrobiota bacterium]
MVLIVANLAWTTACLGGYRPETMVVTSALNAVLLATHFLSRAFSRVENRTRAHPAGWWLLPFLVYGVVNVLRVTPVGWLGWKDWLGWAQMILVFWVVVNAVRGTAARTFLFAGLVLVALGSAAMAGYQRFVKPDWLMMGRIQADQFLGRASGSFGIPNSLAALLLLLIPVLAVLTFRKGAGAVQRVACGYAALALFGALVLTISRGAWLALALVLAGWPIFARGSWRRRVGLTVLAVVGVVAGFLALYFTLPGVRLRFVQMKHDAGEVTRPIMWRGAWRIFREHPAWGGGAGSYNVLFEKHRPERYQDEPTWAHNDYLNTLSDYGAVGFVLFFGAAGVLSWRAVGKQTAAPRDWLDEPRVQGALAAGAVAFALQLFVDFHFKIPALGMAFAIVTALMVQRAWPVSGGAPAGPRWPLALQCAAAAVVLVAAAAWVIPFYRAEALRYAARQSISRMARADLEPGEERRELERALSDLGRATELNPRNGQAWADLAYATALWSRMDRARIKEHGRDAEAAAARALALSQVVPDFWVRRGVALDMQGRRAEAGDAFVHALSLAPASAGFWYYQAYHLSLNKTDGALALAAANFCLRLDPGNVEAQSLRQRLASAQRLP